MSDYRNRNTPDPATDRTRATADPVTDYRTRTTADPARSGSPWGWVIGAIALVLVVGFAIGMMRNTGDTVATTASAPQVLPSTPPAAAPAPGTATPPIATPPAATPPAATPPATTPPAAPTLPAPTVR